MIRRADHRRPAGRLLAVLTIAAYGSAGVLGYGLHTLWGCRHGSLHGPATASDCCCCHDAAADSSSGSQPHQEPWIGAACDDCAICSFLALAQTSVLAPLAVVGDEPATLAASAPPSLVLIQRADARLARGPPSA